MARDSEKARLRRKKWKQENPDKNKAADKKWRDENPATIRQYNRKQSLKAVGWSVEMYDAVFVSQNGTCDICKNPQTVGRLKGVLSADHEHTTPPKPRGLLCNDCNLGLGQFKDNPFILDAAAAYLRKHGKV